jgi:hypothetical protein
VHEFGKYSGVNEYVFINNSISAPGDYKLYSLEHSSTAFLLKLLRYRESSNISHVLMFVSKDFLMGLYNWGEGGGLMYGGLIYGPHLVLIIIFIVPVNLIVNEKKYKQTICNIIKQVGQHIIYCNVIIVTCLSCCPIMSPWAYIHGGADTRKELYSGGFIFGRLRYLHNFYVL